MYAGNYLDAITTLEEMLSDADVVQYFKVSLYQSVQLPCAVVEGTVSLREASVCVVSHLLTAVMGMSVILNGCLAA